jgi:Peptidase family M50.
MLTGFFKEFTVFMILIIIHELGHIAASILYNWEIEQIIILPFGGITIFNEKINRPLKEELIIALSGPIFQILCYMFLSLFSNNDLVSRLHYVILIFNLLPIIPLDGSKICNIFFNYFFSYKRSHILTIYLSIIFMIIFSFKINNNLIMILILLFLILQFLKEVKNHHFYFKKFLLERYLYEFTFKKNKNIIGNNFKKMKRDYTHTFFIKKEIYNEKEFLKFLFK